MMKKRALSMLLAVTMLFSLVPSVIAEELDDVPSEAAAAAQPVVAEEPVVVEQPAAEEPVTEEPVAEEPVVVEQPVAEEPVAEEAEAEEPETVEQLSVEEPAAEQPVAEEPETVEQPAAEDAEAVSFEAEDAVAAVDPNAFHTGLAYVAGGASVYSDERCTQESGVVAGRAVAYVTACASKSGEAISLTAKDVLKVALNNAGSIVSVYVKYADVSYMSAAQAEAYTAANHAIAVEYRDVKLEAAVVNAVAQAAAVSTSTASAPVIATQPKDAAGSEGETVQFSVTASGGTAPYTYQWQFRTGDAEWKNVGSLSGATARTMYVPVTEARYAYQWRCVVTDAAGLSVESSAAAVVKKSAVVTPDAAALAIKTQPQNVTTAADVTVKFTVAAEGGTAPYAYQWQCRVGSGEWKNVGTLEGATTSTILVPMTEARFAYQWRCVVTDKAGKSVTSDWACGIKASSTPSTSELAVKTQPQDTPGTVGETVKFTVVAEGGTAPYTYQWQCRVGSGDWKNVGTLEGATTATISVPVTEARYDYQWRCSISDKAGKNVLSSAAAVTKKSATSAVAIKTQPESVNAAVGATVKFTVAAEGGTAPYTYQWQFMNSTTPWKNVGSLEGSTTATISVPVTDARYDYQWRCVVTDKAGKTATSNAARFSKPDTKKLTVKVQPVSVSAAVNTTVKFTATVEGGTAPYTYQWQLMNSTTDWKNVTTLEGSTTATISVPVTDARYDYKWRCVVTDKTGATGTSEAAVFVQPDNSDPVTITVHPVDTYGKVNDVVKFTVAAEGGSGALSYQWQFMNSTTDWKNVGSLEGSTTATISVPVTDARYDYKWRCVVTDKAGKSATSNAAAITKNPVNPLTIAEQPVDTYGKVGDTVKFTVAAEGGTAPYTYQWQFMNSTTDWKNVGSLEGSTTATISVPVTDARYDYKWRCVVTDKAGKTATSDAAAVTKTPVNSLTIAAQPKDVYGKVNDTVKFSVAVEGGTAPYTYQWQMMNSTTPWKSVTTLEGATTDTMSVLVTDVRYDYKWRCIVTDKTGKSATSEYAVISKTPIVDPDAAELVISSQSEDTEGKVGEIVKFTVVAEGGTAPYTYQWQLMNSTTAWKNVTTLEGSTTDTISVLVTDVRYDYQWRCIVTDKNGSTVESKAVMVVKPEEEIILDAVVYAMNEDGKTLYIKAYNGSASMVVIPQTVQGMTVTAVGPSAFEGNTNLRSIDLPDTVQTIGKRAFANCINLSEMK